MQYKRPGRRTILVRVFLADSFPADLPEALKPSLAGAGLRLVPSHGLVPEPHVGLAAPAADLPGWRKLGARIARAVVGLGQEELRLDGCPGGAEGDALALGLAQGGYAFDRYRPQAATRLHTAAVDGVTPAQATRWSAMAGSLDLGRDLINTPAMDLGPAHFVAAARKACRGSGLKVKVIDEAALIKLGAGAITAVGAAAAADRRPRLLVIDWPGSGSGAKTAKGKSKARPLALCGKGVCFDSGGLQIKPGKSMELMRKDMGGAATVLAAMLAHAASGSARPVRAYLPLVENAVAGEAFRPGDVLTALDGTTIEVGHTDAEGRLVLADAISLAVRDGCRGVVTVATLTGAALVALGRIHVPLMGSDEGLLQAVEHAAAASGEAVWRLPLEEEHHQLIRSKLATITNSAGPDAACITAGAFLAHFAGALPFAHCDISPASWAPGASDLGPAGATGVLVATLARLADSY